MCSYVTKCEKSYAQQRAMNQPERTLHMRGRARVAVVKDARFNEGVPMTNTAELRIIVRTPAAILFVRFVSVRFPFRATGFMPLGPRAPFRCSGFYNLPPQEVWTAGMHTAVSIVIINLWHSW